MWMRQSSQVFQAGNRNPLMWAVHIELDLLRWVTFWCLPKSHPENAKYYGCETENNEEKTESSAEIKTGDRDPDAIRALDWGKNHARNEPVWANQRERWFEAWSSDDCKLDQTRVGDDAASQLDVRFAAHWDRKVAAQINLSDTIEVLTDAATTTTWSITRLSYLSLPESGRHKNKGCPSARYGESGKNVRDRLKVR